MHYKDKLFCENRSFSFSVSHSVEQKKNAVEQKELSEAIQPLACFPIISLSLGQTLLRLLRYPVSPLNGGRGIKMLLREIETEALEGEVTSRGRESGGGGVGERLG